MIEATMCMNCGESMSREVIYNDIQLEVASHDVQGYERITELLDIYFTDEELDVNLCCIGSKKFKGFRIGRLPQAILVTVLRYKMNKFGRAVKISTPILLENVVNFGKYTQPQMYRLKGVILHHGTTPRSGHDTAVLADGAMKVEINDSSFTIYEGNRIMTNSYIALYEQIPSTEDISCLVLSDATRYLCESESFRKQMDSESEVDGISVRKVKILRLLSEGHDDSKYVTELLRQGIKTLAKKPISSSMKEQMNYILTYCFGQNPSGFKERFGITSIQVLKCPTCDFNDFTEVHDVVIDSSDITNWNNSVESQKSCILCRMNLQTNRKIVTYIGYTLLCLIETKESPNENWNVLALMKSGHFPKQGDFSSCGAMICLYSKMLVSGATVMETGAVDKDVRMFLLNEVIQTLYKNSEDSFGLQTVIYARDMDDIVHDIVTNTENNRRHNRFMENPEKMDLESTTCFGSTFLSQTELQMIQEHLLWRYFVRKKNLLPCLHVILEFAHLLMLRFSTANYVTI
ncbi:USP44_49 [Mytilus coruscus]|uniref:USP44_49 n=1 Tax=Mytilus coruscus TaxID=42192 RepID=A0A6J8F1U3_MYTCO|nr:USP44_49 [Mytilus coruscus]